MAGTRRYCTRCRAPDGARVALQGHQCPFRKTKASQIRSAATPRPVVDSTSPPSSPPSSPSIPAAGVDPPPPFIASSPFNPDTVHVNALNIHTNYMLHTPDSFNVASPLLNTTPNAPSPFGEHLDYIFDFTSVPAVAHTNGSGFHDLGTVQVLNSPNHDNILDTLDDDLNAFFNMPASSPADFGGTPTELVTPSNGCSAEAFIATPAVEPVVHEAGPVPGPPSPALVPSTAPESHGGVSDTAPTGPAVRTAATSGVNVRKWKNADARLDDDSSDEDGDRGLQFIQNPTARTKAHSKRAKVLLKKAVALNRVSQPYLLIYCARPESICHKNGVATTFISNNLRGIIGDDFIRKLHEKVMHATHTTLFSADASLQINLEVERLRQEKEEEKARCSILQTQLDEMQQRFAELGFSQTNTT